MDPTRLESPNVVRINLKVLFDQIFKHQSIQSFCVYEGIPEDAILVSGMLTDDCMAYLEFDRAVPSSIKCRVIDKGFSSN